MFMFISIKVECVQIEVQRGPFPKLNPREKKTTGVNKVLMNRACGTQCLFLLNVLTA